MLIRIFLVSGVTAPHGLPSSHQCQQEQQQREQPRTWRRLRRPWQSQQRQRHNGEDLPGVSASPVSPHLLLYTLPSASSQSRRTYLKGKCLVVLDITLRGFFRKYYRHQNLKSVRHN
ncbi:unnamed protein product [Acanthoscelides obtectus]|uniref:Uncharacterized protein n=1 Tax=Acanthoscelides obtectus TaxID=200917 RepID=A0A9P0K6V8_ACAOB|nr:unnamed protein product [Acanthoscelides obtectus]CAK1647195.1 hypothetical protein AOBTE_LOCUS15098 [Acanthoscelides obtectus]